VFAALHYQYIDPHSVHAMVVYVLDFAEKILGPTETVSAMRATPEFGPAGNLALALVVDSCLAPVKLMALVPIVTKIEAIKQARRK
jgi:hypothetical protein